MNLTVHIDRLVLDGVALSPAGRPLLKATVETELARLLAAPASSSRGWSSSEVPRLAAGPVILPPDGAPGRLGAAIARAVHTAVRP